MSHQKSEPNSNPETNALQQVDRQPSSADRQKQRRESVAWWIKLILQPLMTVAAIILIVFAFGLAQRLGWFTSNEQVAMDSGVIGEDVLYICPMVCVPPSSEPGNCPVCGMKLKAQKSSGDAKDRYGLKLDQASIRVANIKTVAAQSVPLDRQIRAFGEIGYDEGSLATISAYVDGRIDKLYADYTGVQVKEGDELALLYSPDLYSSQVALLESRKLMKQGRKTNQRISDTNREFYESSRQRLIEFGLTEKQVDQLEARGNADSRIRITSPIAGTVIEKIAFEGKYIKTGQAIYKVADLSSVWLMLEMFPRDAAKIRFGQKVVTKIQSLPGTEFVGRIAFIDPTVNAKTQTVHVRVVIPNEKGLIRIGDFATASITASVILPADQKKPVFDPELAGKWISPRHPHVISDQPGKCRECGMDLVPASQFGFVDSPIEKQSEVVVPRNSVLMAGDVSVVYVETETGRFEFRNVEIGQIVGDQVSIVKGVKPGELVVASATMLVDSQFNMAGKPSLIDPNRAIPREPEIPDEFNTPEVIAAMANLSEADRKLAIAQKSCPVADMPLGSMGTPLKVDVNGQPVFICCEGCRARLLNTPAKYLAKLPAAAGDDEAKEIAKALASLSDSDRRLAIAQKTCPVADMPLGSMGTPLKIDVNGRPVFICCEGCRERLLNTPAKYLAKLPKAADDDESKEIAKALASLSDSDRRLALRQKTCPVADMPLGSMGTPLKVDVNGRPVFICCEGCRERLLNTPAKYLAKLPEEGSNDSKDR